MDGANSNPYIPGKLWAYGLSSFDQTHMFVANYLWEVPKLSSVLPNPAVRAVFDDWEVSGITTFASGTPSGIAISTTGGYDFSGGDAGNRVDIVGTVPASTPTFDRWFNPASVALPAKGTAGNAAVRNFRLPGFNNWDLAVMKNIRIKEKAALRLRAEGYNAFNHTQYSGVNTAARFDSLGNQTNALLGQISSTRSPRVMQFSASIKF
jgi:hypothetical protein